MTLFDSERHEALAGEAWSESSARAGLRELIDGLLQARRSDGRWEGHPLDASRDGPPNGPSDLYYGAAGVILALLHLAEDGHFERQPWLADAAHDLVRQFPHTPDLEVPGWFLGTTGVAAVALSLRWDEELAETVLAAIRSNADNPTWEALWGSPGTMIAAWLIGQRAADPAPWRAAWNHSAERLIAAQDADGLWTQDLYGQMRRLTGAGHGMVGNLHPLLRPWGEDGPWRLKSREALQTHVLRADGAANWPPAHGSEKILVQWCHGSPGVLTGLRAWPADREIDALFIEAGELVWRAGPLTKGGGLCHGTAGNGWALLALFERTRDRRWLDRARAFGMHALAQCRTHRASHGQVRASLFTGDAGVACFLGALLDEGGAWPGLDRL